MKIEILINSDKKIKEYDLSFLGYNLIKTDLKKLNKMVAGENIKKTLSKIYEKEPKKDIIFEEVLEEEVEKDIIEEYPAYLAARPRPSVKKINKNISPKEFFS